MNLSSGAGMKRSPRTPAPSPTSSTSAPTTSTVTSRARYYVSVLALLGVTVLLNTSLSANRSGAPALGEGWWLGSAGGVDVAQGGTNAGRLRQLVSDAFVKEEKEEEQREKASLLAREAVRASLFTTADSKRQHVKAAQRRSKDTDAAVNVQSDAAKPPSTAQGPVRLSIGSTSRATIRTTGDFGRYALDHVVDMENVVFQDGAIHFYGLSPQGRQAMDSIDFKSCCLQIKSQEVYGYGVNKVYHDEPLDVDAVCHASPQAAQWSTSHAFFLAGYHLDNICHLIIDNLLALVSNVLYAPQCGNTVPCRSESVLFRFADFNPKGPSLASWDALFAKMFSRGQRKAATLFTGGPYCVARASWGLGIKHLYHAYVDLKQESMAKLRSWLIDTYNVTTHIHRGALPGLHDFEADRLDPFSPGYVRRRAEAGAPLRALYIDRAKKQGSNRHFEDHKPILTAFANEGVDVEVVQDFGGGVAEQLGMYTDADIFIGLHGAGLTNAMFGRKGLVVVEYKSAYGSAECYRKIAQSREGGYVMVPLLTPADNGAHVLPMGLSEKVASCVMGMMDGDMSACIKHHGYVYGFEKGHKQDCVWQGSSCNPMIIGLHNIPPPKD